MNLPSLASWRKRLGSPLAVHIEGVGALTLVVVALLVRIGIDWSAAGGGTARVAAGEKARLDSLTMATAPLRGLDKRVAAIRQTIDSFYTQRIPATYSAIAIRIGEIGTQSGVRLSRVTYTQGPRGNDLTEISIDAGISGEYPGIMKFVNGLERDRTFFVIRAMTLNGQESGQVNLRLRFSAWLRPADAEASGLPMTAGDKPASRLPNDNKKE